MVRQPAGLSDDLTEVTGRDPLEGAEVLFAVAVALLVGLAVGVVTLGAASAWRWLR